MNSRAIRLARGWVVGVFATASAALSHAFAGGGTPSPLALAVGVVFGGMLGTFALAARPSLPRLVIAVGVSQLAFHLAFSTLGAAASVVPAVHQHGAVMVAAVPAHSHGDPATMWVAHAIAGVLTLALLRAAERAGWRMLVEFARLVVSSFRIPAAAPTPLPRVVAPRTETRVIPPLSATLTSAVSRRGPPLSVAF